MYRAPKGTLGNDGLNYLMNFHLIVTRIFFQVFINIFDDVYQLESNFNICYLYKIGKYAEELC